MAKFVVRLYETTRFLAQDEDGWHTTSLDKARTFPNSGEAGEARDAAQKQFHEVTFSIESYHRASSV